MSANPPKLQIAIVDYGLGNLFSVVNACGNAGIDAYITSSPAEILAAPAVILPGVGAFRDAMECLHRIDLVEPLKDYASSGKPLFGICLGQQLLFSESEEFGSTKGLDILKGTVRSFDNPRDEHGRALKVPHVGWNLAVPPADRPDAWRGTPLEPHGREAMMYFVHSFCAVPDDPSAVLAMTIYGDHEFCSAVRTGGTYAFQFHPERSGMEGIRFYSKIRDIISENQNL